VEHGLEDRDEPVVDQDPEQLVELAEVLDVQLVQVARGQILEADRETLVLGAIPRADGSHVRLNTHQQDGVEPLRLPIGGVLPDLVRCRSPRQRPRGVRGQDRGCAVGVHQAAAAGRHPPEAVGVERVGLFRAGSHLELACVRAARPPPPAGLGRGEADAPGPATVPERRAPQPQPGLVLELGPDLDSGVRVCGLRDAGQLEFVLTPQ
jgi:hypothetical protein